MRRSAARCRRMRARPRLPRRAAQAGVVAGRERAEAARAPVEQRRVLDPLVAGHARVGRGAGRVGRRERRLHLAPERLAQVPRRRTGCPARAAARRASRASSARSTPWPGTWSSAATSASLRCTPVTSWPCSTSSAAATALSTPPDMATSTSRHRHTVRGERVNRSAARPRTARRGRGRRRRAWWSSRATAATASEDPARLAARGRLGRARPAGRPRGAATPARSSARVSAEPSTASRQTCTCEASRWSGSGGPLRVTPSMASARREPFGQHAGAGRAGRRGRHGRLMAAPRRRSMPAANVPDRTPRSCPPPWLSGSSGRPRRSTATPTPCGAPNLWAEIASASTCQASTSTSRVATAWTASVCRATPRSRSSGPSGAGR